MINAKQRYFSRIRPNIEPQRGVPIESGTQKAGWRSLAIRVRTPDRAFSLGFGAKEAAKMRVGARSWAYSMKRRRRDWRREVMGEKERMAILAERVEWSSQIEDNWRRGLIFWVEEDIFERMNLCL